MTLCLCSLLRVEAYDYKDFSFRNFNSASAGFASTAIRSLAQDKYGFIWIGGDLGLDRYDGVAIRHFPLKGSSQSQTPDCLMSDGNTLWIATYDGLYLLDLTTEQLKPFDVATAQGIKVKGHVSSVDKDKDGAVWISTIGQGVFRYTPHNNHLEMMLRGCQIAQIYVDSHNQVWGYTSWKEPGLWRLDKARGRFIPVTVKGVGRITGLAMTESTNGDLWLGTWENGLVRLDRTTMTATAYLGPMSPVYALHVHSVIEYQPGQLLLGTDNGLIRYDINSNSATAYVKDELNPSSISDNFIYPIFKDHEGGLWIGTFYAGLSYVSPNSGRFKGFGTSKFHNSVHGNIINRFCEDTFGNIWIASDDGGLNRYNPQTQTFSSLALGNGALTSNNVHALCMDGTQLWVGTYTGGVYVVDTKTGHVVASYGQDTSSPHSLDGTSSYTIFRDSRANIWVTTMTGVNLYRRATDDFTHVKRLGTLTIDIKEDRRGNLWFCTQGEGMFCYQPITRKWEHIKNEPGDTTSLPDNNVNCINIPQDGNIYVGTDKGLCQLITKTGKFQRIDIKGIKAVYSIIDENDILWLTTDKGLVKYEGKGQYSLFDTYDGLRSNRFLPNAALKTSDGCIYLGTINGFNSFYPYQIKENGITPHVYITQLDVMNHPLQVGDDRLPKSLNETSCVRLSHHDKMLTIHFASLSYSTPEKNQYSYWLEGFDKEWNDCGRQTKATYTNLSPGTYTFHVRGSNNDGGWGRKEATLTIIIDPPFYWSTSAKIIYFFLLIALLGLLFYRLVRREKLRHEMQMKKLKEEQEYEMRNSKIRFFTMIAHEIRTPVSLIIGPLESLIKSAHLTDSERNNLNIIDRNAHRLLDLVNQLLDFRKVEQQTYVMKFTVENICDLMKAVSERFEPTFTQSHVQFVTEYPDEHFTAIVDREAITKVISNLLTNARKYTKDYVRLSCIISPDDEHFVIEVEDNGVGISKSDHDRIFNAFYQAANNKPGTGIGLSIVKNIVNMHHGMIDVNSEPGHGSTFIVTLPMKQAEIESDKTETSTAETASGVKKTKAVQTRPVSVEPKKEEKNEDITILIVDDNEDMLTYISGALSKNYRTLKAHDGIEALGQLFKNHVSLIISDWMMPRMDGPELCRKVRGNVDTSHIPLIMLTAKTDNDSKTEGMNCGADTYIEKPFSMDYLEATCRNILSLRKMLRDKFNSKPFEPVSEIASTTIDDELLKSVQKLIEDNVGNPQLSVDFLAASLAISRSRFFAKIKAVAGISPNEMIQVIRLKKAARLLKEDHIPVNQVGYMVGFNTPSYFTKCFVKQFGIRPSELYQEGLEEE